MSQHIISEINIHKQKLYFKFSDRRTKPFQHVELDIEGTKTQIITRRGERIMQKIILRDKTLADVKEGLRLIDCPEKLMNIVILLLKELQRDTEDDADEHTEPGH